MFVFYFTSEMDIIYISRVANEPARPGKVWSSEKGTGLSPNFVPAESRFGPVLSPNSEPARVRSSEKGTGLSPNSDLPNQGSARSFLRTCRTKVRPCPFSEPGEPGFGPVLSPNLRSFGERNGPFSELPTCRTRIISGPFSERLTRVNSVHLRTPTWNSELRAKTQSWTILHKMATRAKDRNIFKQHFLLNHWSRFNIISQKSFS